MNLGRKHHHILLLWSVQTKKQSLFIASLNNINQSFLITEQNCMWYYCREKGPSLFFPERNQAKENPCNYNFFSPPFCHNNAEVSMARLAIKYHSNRCHNKAHFSENKFMNKVGTKYLTTSPLGRGNLCCLLHSLLTDRHLLATEKDKISYSERCFIKNIVAFQRVL